MLELGSGGGNNASHLKRHFKMTLVDLSPGMLQVSRKLNPECEHIQGDMRSIRLDQRFDAIFIHDAVMYVTSIQDLAAVVETAYVHCRPGGVALFAPDSIKESFKTSTHHGGHDSKDRAMRYLEWSWDPDPEDDTFLSYMVYLLRQKGGEVKCVLDEHLCGLFHRHEWMQTLERAGFIAHSVPFDHSEVESGSTEVFIGVRPS
jgi:ubiquinone/menaquinone biosynthesis C-methylase UbiE